MVGSHLAFGHEGSEAEFVFVFVFVYVIVVFLIVFVLGNAGKLFSEIECVGFAFGFRPRRQRG